MIFVEILAILLIWKFFPSFFWWGLGIIGGFMVITWIVDGVNKEADRLRAPYEQKKMLEWKKREAERIEEWGEMTTQQIKDGIDIFKLTPGEQDENFKKWMKKKEARKEQKIEVLIKHPLSYVHAKQ
ncbi:MAG: hypothetical protein M1153_01165 [Patescibacteria group bacterium]|nr:hypothetical protein [Patescibacteria group bacterium]